MSETKQEKFRRLMPPRLEKAIHHIGLLSNLSSHNYEYSPEEAAEMLAQLEAAVQQISEAFNLSSQLEPEPEPEPEPEDVPERVRRDNDGPWSRGWAAWALDKLNNDPKTAREFLKRALAGEKY